jgi:hypothetical protein
MCTQVEIILVFVGKNMHLSMLYSPVQKSLANGEGCGPEKKTALNKWQELFWKLGDKGNRRRQLTSIKTSPTFWLFRSTRT